MSDLETLYPEAAVVKVGGQEIEIKPLTIGQIPKITRLLREVPLNLNPDAIGTSSYWLGLIGDHGEDVIAAIATASGQKNETIAGLAIDDFVALAVKVIEVNADFFTRKVMPAASQALSGLTLLNGSSAMDTAQ
jgi:hypothetical protein